MTSAPRYRPSEHETIAEVRKRLFDDGVRAAVIYLNSLTDYRFSALYRFTSDAVSSIFFYDRLHPTVTTSPEIPLMHAYCVEVANAARPFCTASALSAAKPAQEPTRVQSFCGVPLIDHEGEMFGTLCHFDFSTRILDRQDLALMEGMAEILKEHDRFVLALMESRRASNAKLWD